MQSSEQDECNLGFWRGLILPIPLYVVLGAGCAQFGILEGVSRPQEIIGGRLYEVFTFRGLHLGDMASIHFCTSAYIKPKIILSI